jgi:hypothetical protein
MAGVSTKGMSSSATAMLLIAAQKENDVLHILEEDLDHRLDRDLPVDGDLA